jgi:tetratricopeptide (TPR) repeat protein
VAFVGRGGVAGDRTRAWLTGALGLTRHSQGRYVEAIALEKEAAVLNQKVMGGDSLDLAISYSNLAYTLLFGGDATAALEVSGRALELFEREAAPDSTTRGTALCNRGEILNALGRPDEALLLFERCAAIWRASILPDSPWYGYSLTGIGQAQLLKKKPSEAVAPLERALALREKGDPSPARLGETRFALARALWDGNVDHLRAHRLAVAARADYAKRSVEASKVAAIDRWLASHSPVSGSRKPQRPRRISLRRTAAQRLARTDAARRRCRQGGSVN